MTPICFINKFGYCKHCEKCRFRHNDEKCQDSKKQIHIAENSDKIDKLEKKLQSIENPKAKDKNREEDLAKLKVLKRLYISLSIKEKDCVIDAMSNRIKINLQISISKK